MKKYCEECGKEVDTKIVTKEETYQVCGEPITVESKILVCSDCGEEFYCEELDSKTLSEAYAIYRRKHKLLFPEEIREIREQYGLSQRGFSKLLNWGDKTIYRYENGSIQDKAHNSMLLFLRKPENLQSYLTENEVLLNSRQKTKLLERIEYLQKNMDYRIGKQFIKQYFSAEPALENGFKSFDYEKFSAMVLYFAHRQKEILKTKLLKLLNYADMLYYKENAVSMSGARYVHLPYGPVPDNFDLLFGTMTADCLIHIEVVYENNYERHQVIPECEIPKEIFSEGEIEVLNRVFEKFADFGSREISMYSHKETGYQATQQGEFIPYSYAKDISID